MIAKVLNECMKVEHLLFGVTKGGSLEEAIFKQKLDQCMTYSGKDGEWRAQEHSGLKHMHKCSKVERGLGSLLI